MSQVLLYRHVASRGLIFSTLRPSDFVVLRALRCGTRNKFYTHVFSAYICKCSQAQENKFNNFIRAVKMESRSEKPMVSTS
jgi:hypothetical protein